MLATDIPVYGPITHANRYAAKKDKNSKVNEAAFMRCLGLEKHRFARIVNYCPEVDPEMKYIDSINPSLDVPVLSFLKQVFIIIKLLCCQTKAISYMLANELRDVVFENLYNT